MKTKLFLASVIILGIGFSSCKKDDSTSKIDKTETISLGAAYVNDIYYSLSSGIVSTVPRATWDIAFSVSTRSSSIIINEGSGVELKVYPTTSGWSWTSPISIANYASWPSLSNSDTEWETGAFNANATGHPNYGWGIYNTNTHNIEGNALYIIKLRNGTFKKIWIEMKYSALQKYSFRYADTDGTNEQIVSNLNISDSQANYVYYSLQDNSRVDREPNATTWDLLFTKWVDNSINYPVTGVLQNIEIPAISVTIDNPANATYTEADFVTNINTIGSNWKVNDPVTHAYTIPTNKTYFVKNKDGKVFQITFTSFAGSTTGDLSFKIKEL